MASAQVLPTSRKQGHLEAGKRRLKGVNHNSRLKAGVGSSGLSHRFGKKKEDDSKHKNFYAAQLEEFRKKKAEGRGKKVVPTGPTQSADVSQDENQPQARESVRHLESDEAATSERYGIPDREPPAVVMTTDTKAIGSSQPNELDSFRGPQTTIPVSDNKHDAYYADTLQKPANNHESKWYNGSGTSEPLYINYGHTEEEKNHNLSSTGTRGPAYEVATDQYIALNPAYGTGGVDKKSSYYSRFEGRSREDDFSSKAYSVKDPGGSHVYDTNISSEKSASFPGQNDVGTSSMLASGSLSTIYADSISSTTKLADSVPQVEQNMHDNLDFNGAMILSGRRKLSNSNNHQPTADSAPWRSSESLPSTDYSLNFKSSSDRVPFYPAASETGNRRARPSFLDSLNVNRVSSVPQLSFTESEKAEPFSSRSSEVNNTSSLFSTASQTPSTDSVTVGPFDKLRTPNPFSSYDPRTSPSVSLGNEGEQPSVMDNYMERKHELPSRKQDEDFAALEQHIEDLTQEKFSLQRALDSSRALAESLATENSSLTDSYNQQGAVVNQLKFDMERLQEEIRAQLLEIESFKMEYGNAQLECDAADERAKILASEVISLEEKALRLRSSELKLERQLENSNAEINSCKKKISSLEKDRQDLQLTIDALQEEKKLLQSKLRKASGSGKSMDAIKTPSVTKDVSTSTEDLGVEVPKLVHDETSGDTMPNPFNPEMQEIASFPSSSSSTFPLPENREFHLSVSSAAIAPDQLRMIDNINSLISELAMEKEELLRALASESSQSSNLKELNKELSRKLEAQTQRLELLTAQSMVKENIQARPTDSRTVHDNAAYTDEGDEVVERVLGWIMKLFPGGPSKRRTSKLL